MEVSLSTPSKDRCLHCGTLVSDAFRRVYGDSDDQEQLP
ncbi:MAG: DUF7563 family protein [Halobacteriota archaeon]